MNSVIYEGWHDCIELKSGEARLIAPTLFGPRIVGLHLGDSPNLFFIKEATRGRIAAEGYAGYGGHRLWLSPEVEAITYAPENDPVAVAEHEDGIELTAPICKHGLQKSIRICVIEGGFRIEHTITNRSDQPIEGAAWGISVMRSGGVCRVPGPPRTPRANPKLATGRIVLWPYAELSDPRYTFAPEGIELRQDLQLPATKFGTFAMPGVATYEVDGIVFEKRFHADPEADYPDFGCNFEAYTREDMLEVESLSPLMTCAPGDAIKGWEEWRLRRH